MRGSKNAALLLALVTFAGCARAKSVAESENRTLTLGFLTPWFVGRGFASAIIPAIENAQRDQLLPGYEIKWSWRESGCNSKIGFQAMVGIWQEEEDLDGIIGPMCSTACQPVALLAAAWNLPVISYGCSSMELSDTEQYPTFVRTTGVETMIAPVVKATMEAFHWDRCAIVAVAIDLHTSLAKEAKRIMEAAGIVVYFRVIEEMRFGDEVDEAAIAEAREVVRAVKKEAFVVCVFMSTMDTRLFLIQAYDEGMVNGEFIFLVNEIEVGGVVGIPIIYREEVTNSVIFEGVLSVVMRLERGPEWEAVMNDVVEAFDDDRFHGYEHVDSVEDVLTSWAANLYDAVFLWFHGVNRTLAKDAEPDNGQAVTDSMVNFMFKSSVSGQVTIDYKGDRKQDRRVIILQAGTTTTSEVSEVTLFIWHAAEDQLEKVYKPENEDDWSGVFWGAGSTTVPPGFPPCGWEKELCQENSTLIYILAGACSGLFLVVAFTVIVMYRRLKTHNQEEILRSVINISDVTLLEKMTLAPAKGKHEMETVDPSEVHTGGCGDDGFKRSSPALMVLDNDSTSEQRTFHAQQLLVSAGNVGGFFRDRKIVARVYNHGSTSTTQAAILKEVGTMLPIKHENMNPFVGLCFAHSRVFILMEYASKESLQDLIESDAVKLSWDIKVSLATDITRGLKYLHRSDLRYHGHLKSSNCVVDSRWVCKITDYGFVNTRSVSLMIDEVSDYDKLWIAPEILRQGSLVAEKVDIYSFGIILQEILAECEPFGDNEPIKSTEEIVAAVKDQSTPPYRPIFHNKHYDQRWITLCESCWQESAEDRPTPTQILKIIGEINGGRLPSLVDLMINNLEKETRNLENIVKERSEELREEQRKMDTLLQELLPKSVCEQLKQGLQVAPEKFDDVTLFFSDIVGFTRVSAQSTPIQVVSMLNTLYSQFDVVLQMHDVYKVATIGDAYVVGSGVPIRNGDRHATEIAAMSLEMLDTIRDFKIPHLQNEYLHMRIGLHTGGCVAALTGIKTPRYLLFGETVDTAGRIEAGGEKMRVHISHVTADLVRNNDYFCVEYRGEMAIKGVGSIETYWLDRRDPEKLPPSG